MRKVCLVLCAVLILLSFCGCTSKGSTDSDTASRSAGIDTYNTGIITFPSYITDVLDFQCVCSLNDKESFTIDGENAKEIYAVISDIFEQSEKTEFQVYDGNYLYLSFQSGEANSAESGSFYGDFSLSESDYLRFSAAPMISFGEEYKIPEGAYARLFDLVSKYSQSGN